MIKISELLDLRRSYQTSFVQMVMLIGCRQDAYPFITRNQLVHHQMYLFFFFILLFFIFFIITIFFFFFFYFFFFLFSSFVDSSTLSPSFWTNGLCNHVHLLINTYIDLSPNFIDPQLFQYILSLHWSLSIVNTIQKVIKQFSLPHFIFKQTKERTCLKKRD